MGVHCAHACASVPTALDLKNKVRRLYNIQQLVAVYHNGRDLDDSESLSEFVNNQRKIITVKIPITLKDILGTTLSESSCTFFFDDKVSDVVKYIREHLHMSGPINLYGKSSVVPCSEGTKIREITGCQGNTIELTVKDTDTCLDLNDLQPKCI